MLQFNAAEQNVHMKMGAGGSYLLSSVTAADMSTAAALDATNAWAIVRDAGDAGSEIISGITRVHLKSLTTSEYLRNDSPSAMSWTADATAATTTAWILEWTGTQTATTEYALRSPEVIASDRYLSTAGVYTGATFTAFDFSNGGNDITLNENLIVTVDGVDQTIALTANIDTAEAAVTALAGLTGATASVSSGNVVITSNSGMGSAIAIAGSDTNAANAAAIFGSGTSTTRPAFAASTTASQWVFEFASAPVVDATTCAGWDACQSLDCLSTSRTVGEVQAISWILDTASTCTTDAGGSVFWAPTCPVTDGTVTDGTLTVPASQPSTPATPFFALSAAYLGRRCPLSTTAGCACGIQVSSGYTATSNLLTCGQANCAGGSTDAACTAWTVVAATESTCDAPTLAASEAISTGCLDGGLPSSGPASTCLLACQPGYTPSSPNEGVCTVHGARTSNSVWPASYDSPTITCTDVSCPASSTGTNVPTGCTCQAGYTGTIAATAIAPDYFSGACAVNICACTNGNVVSPGADCLVHGEESCTGCQAGYSLLERTNGGNTFSSCAAVTCPANSADASDSATPGVPGGCTCAAGYTGGVTATSATPFFTNTCAINVCPCTNGVAVADGTACTSHGAEQCASCAAGYRLSTGAVLTCVAVPCSEVSNSVGTNVPSTAGCTCAAGYSGIIAATTTAPYFEGACATVCKWAYVGCFCDNEGGRDMIGNTITGVSSVPIDAANDCAAVCDGYSYFGLQRTNECHCDNSYNNGYGTNNDQADCPGGECSITDCDADGVLDADGTASLCANGAGNCANRNAVYRLWR